MTIADLEEIRFRKHNFTATWRNAKNAFEYILDFSHM